MIDLNSNFIILPVVLPLLFSAITFFIGVVLDSRENNLYFALSSSLIAFINLFFAVNLYQIASSQTILYNVGGWPAPFGIQLVVDQFSAIMLILINLIACFVFIAGYQLNEKENFDIIIGSLWMIFLASLNGICISGDLFNIFVFLEISSIITYILVAAGGKDRSYESAFNYLLIGSIGTTFFVLGIGIIYLLVGSLNIIDISDKLSNAFSSQSSSALIYPLPGNKILYLGMIFMVLGISVKSAIMPLGMWLTDVYQNSSNTFTTLLSGTATKVSLFILLKLYKLFSVCQFLDASNSYILYLLPFSLALLSVLVSYYACYEDDFKRILALSSLSQILYIAVAISLFSDNGVNAALIHIINHSIIKVPLFMLAGIWIYTFNSSSLRELQGSGQKLPFGSLLLFMLSLSLVGIPGTAGFISKWYLINTVWISKNAAFVIIPLLISSVLSLVYLSRLFIILWFISSEETYSSDLELKSQNSVPNFSLAITFLFSIFAIILGWYIPL